MNFRSTRGGTTISLSEAVRRGAAPDGGLYMPVSLPAFEPAQFDPQAPLAKFAADLLKPFFEGDGLNSELPAICAEAFGFPMPLVIPDAARPDLYALELFHGPTGAFKDFGARFLMACFDRLGKVAEPLTVLVATSGDTGGAVGCAAEGRRSIRAVILFPKGKVSPFQERQLTCWGEPVLTLEVDGDFDDCQKLVKAAFLDPALVTRHRLTSANSINIGRVLPQVAFVAHAAIRPFAQTGVKPGFVVPTGNLGHGFALLLARAIGMPVGPIVFATNANRTLSEWWATGQYVPRAAIATLANAMDVGNPSNFERLIALPEQQRQIRIELVDDDAIKRRIGSDFEASDYVWCPHSATAAEAYGRLPEAERAERPWVVVATAHPYKFAETIAAAIGRDVAPTAALASIGGRQVRKVCVGNSLRALADALDDQKTLNS